MYRDALFNKKQAKVRKYEIKGGGKKYKKYLIQKRFKEDAQGKGRSIPQKDKEALNAKLKALYHAQSLATPSEGASEAPEKTGLELVEEIDEQYFSDLKPEDIPDDCVSEVDMEAIQN